MEIYTVLIGYFEELEKFKYNTTQFTFNGYTVDAFKDYKINLTMQYNDFKNKLDTLLLGDLTTDKLMRILGVLDVRITKIHEQANVKYNKFADTFKFMVVKVEGHEPATIKSGRFTKNPELQSLDSIFQFHINIVRLTNEVVKTRFEVIKDANTDAINGIPNDRTLNQQDDPTEPTTVNFKNIEITKNSISLPANYTSDSNPNKLTLFLSKNEVAMFFIFLYNNNIINPADRQELYSFIENNFRYIDNSTGKRSISDIIDVNGTFSKITSGNVSEKYNKQKDKKATKYQGLINDFFENFKKYKLYKFRDAF